MTRRPHLGWLQQTILTLIWNREMYGLEIMRNLFSMDEKVSPGQLYPALKRLTELGAVTAREEEKVGADRKYYAITELGKTLLLQNFKGLFHLIESLMVEKSTAVFERALNLLDITPGVIVIDLSVPFMDRSKIEIASAVAPTGRYIMFSRNETHSKLIRERDESDVVNSTMTLFNGVEEVYALPDDSVDFAMVFFTMHEDGTDWIPAEMKRLLKSGGRGLIVDVLNITNHVVIDILVDLIPGHNQMGIDPDIMRKQLTDVGLKIIDTITDDWMVFFLVEG